MRPSRRPAVIILTVIALLISIVTPVLAKDPSAVTGGPAQVGTDELARDSWIVTLDAGTDAAAAAPGLARAAGGRAGAVYSYALNGFQFRGSAQAAAALERNPHVASVVADSAIFLAETLPYGIERVWAYRLGGQTGAYQAGFRGNGARIAVLDTGIDLDHPELAASIDNAYGKNCITAGAAPNDGYGHGTHVAGTAAAPINGVGVAGIAPQARLVAVKMFTDSGSSSNAAAICALDHIVALNTDGVATNDVDVANMSWTEVRTWHACGTTLDPLHDAICAADAAGIILVAGAGNSAANASNNVPAAYPEVLSVSALADFDGDRGGLAGCGFVPDLFANECDDTFAFFSNYGPVDLIAPGVNIYSSWANGTWRASSGTSMATPHVVGIAALMAAAAPGLTPAQARAAFLASGECPNGQAADADGAAGCGGQGTWPGDPDGTPEPMAHALRAAQAAVAMVAAPEPPSAPTLSASATATSIDLSWTAPVDDGGDGIDGYEIYRGATAGSAVLYDTTVGPGLTYSDTAVAADETWYYQVAAVNSAGVGDRSNEAGATVPGPQPPEAPSAPSLSAAATPTSVDLSWTVPVDDGGAAISGYEIYRGATTGTASLYTTVDEDVLAWSDLGVAAGETWFYQVAAVNAVDTGARSNEVSATVPFPPPPSAPTLSATAGNASVTLNWTAPTDDGGADVTNYEIYRSTTAGAAAYLTTVGDVQTFTDTGPTNGTTYYYQVAAINSAGTGARSNEASAQPTAPITVPSAPRQLKAQKVQGGIRLTWLAPTSNGGSPLTAYRVYRSGGPQSVVWTLLPGNLTFTDTTVAPRTYYGYAVRAVNVAGESAASNVVLVKTQ